MKAVLLALASSALLISSGCSPSPPAITDAGLRCPPVPSDIIAESRRKPVVKGDTGTEIAANLILQGHTKNAALRRAITAHEDCRKS